MDILVTLADFVNVVGEINKDKIVLARKNYLNNDFTDSIVVVDNLNSETISRKNEYDGEAEQMKYIVYYKASMTIDFYGDNGLTNANKFIARLKSQTAYEFKRDNNVEIFNNKNLQNIKNIQGKTTYDRFQLEIVVKYSETYTEDVLRIDTAQTEVYVNN